MTIKSFKEAEGEIKRLNLALASLTKDTQLLRERITYVTGSSSAAPVTAGDADGVIVAGAGLTGGGTLPGTVTLRVGAGDGIVVSPTSIAVDHAAPSLTFTTSNADGSATTYVRTDAGLAIFDAVVPTTIEPDDGAAAGSAAYAARRDHTHAIAAALAGTIEPDDSVSEGVSTSFSRADHQHAIATVAPDNDSVSLAASAEGSASSFARSDHTHQLDESIAPTWTGIHIFREDIQLESGYDLIFYSDTGATEQGRINAATGELTVGDDAIAGNRYIDINTAAGQYRKIRFKTAGDSRWSIGVNDDAESGSEVGSDFEIANFDDSGVYVGVPIRVNRATGYVGINTGSPDRRLEARDASSPQLRLTQSDSVDYVDFQVDSDGYLTITPSGDRIDLPDTTTLRAASYASQTTGWGISPPGDGDFRYLFADELHAKAFIADLEQALAGGQIICKSVTSVASDFTLPTAGNTGTLWVRDLPGANNTAVFEDGDFVGMRQFSRAAGSLTIAWAWGTVATHADGTGANEGFQSWQFTRSTTAGAATGTISTDTIVLDFGVSGMGYHEINAIDGSWGINSPYAQVVTWDTHPATRTVRTRTGNLLGVTSTAEWGFYAGDGAAAAGNRYLRLSDTNFDIHNIDVEIHDGAATVIKLDYATPYFSIGSSAPTAFGTGDGIWMGDDSGTYKFRVGDVNGEKIEWDGTDLWIYADSNYYMRTDGASMKFFAGGDEKLTLDVSGTSYVRIGNVGSENVLVHSGGVRLRYGTTVYAKVEDGKAWFGDSDSTERLEWATATGMRLYDQGDNAVISFPPGGDAQIVGTLDVTSPGVVTAGGEVVKLDSTGFKIRAPVSQSDAASYKFVTADGSEDTLAAIHGVRTGVGADIWMHARVNEDDSHDNAGWGEYVWGTVLAYSRSTVYATGANSPNGYIDIRATDADDEVVFSVTGDNLVAKFVTDEMRIDGSVKIGDTTSAPTSGIELQVAADSPSIRISDMNSSGAATVGAWLRYYHGLNTTEAGEIGFNGAGNFNMNNQNGGGNVNLQLGGTSYLIVNASGYVQIPSHDLRVDVGLSVGDDSINPAQGQIIIDCGAQDDEVLTLISSDVAHGMTALTRGSRTDTYGYMEKAGGAGGGLRVTGLAEGTIALQLDAFPTTVATSHGTANAGAITMWARMRNGTSYGNITADANVLTVRTYIGGASRSLMHLDAEGDLHLDAGAGTSGTIGAWVFDDYDDVKLLHAVRASLVPDGHYLRERFGEFIEYARPILEAGKVISYNDGPGEDGVPFVNIKRLQYLTIDAVRQLHDTVRSQGETIERLEHKLLQLEAG